MSSKKGDNADYFISYKEFAHQASAILLTKAFFLAPLERMKIVLQVKHLAQFVNPADKPTNALDLSNSK
jgi:hypothetical protein